MVSKHKSLLIVEDQHLILSLIKSILQDMFGTVYSALNGKIGLEIYKEHKPDIVLTDLHMPEMNGLEMIQHIRAIDPEAKIIIISAYSDTKYLLQAIDMGVNGFHIKPIHNERLKEQVDQLLKQLTLEEKASEEEEKFRVLSSAARDAIIMMDPHGKVTFWNQGAERIFGYKKDEIIGKELHKIISPNYYWDDYKKAMPEFRKSGQGQFVGKTTEMKALRKDKTSLTVELSLTSVKLNDDWNAIGIMRDISDRIAAEQELIKAYKKLDVLAHTDHLTQISNRLDMMEKLNYEKNRFERSGQHFSIAIGDLDAFKNINDSYGHLAGDEVLKSVSGLMRSNIRKQDVVGRWGGEEFILMYPKTDLSGAMIVTEKIRKIIDEYEFKYENHTIHTSITFGVTSYNKDMDIDECIKIADNALYQGKEQGKNCVMSILDDNIKK